MRRANGSGSITKLKDKKRRKPWRVRVTENWEFDIETGKCRQTVKLVGNFATRKEAENALVDYLKCPYDLSGKKLTFKELYESWSEEYFRKLKSDSSARSVTSAYNYCSSLYSMPVRAIRSYHLKECMENGYVIKETGKEKGQKKYATAKTKARMKSMFNLLFDYAYERELVDRNYARAFNVSDVVGEDDEKEKRETVPFSEAEIQKLWEAKDSIRFVDMILVAVYSGWRPQELAILKAEDIDLESGIMRGGMKTKAGSNRIVPIHPLIKGIVEERMKEAESLGSEYLFNDTEGQQGINLTYDKYRGRFNKVMDRLGMTHRPHETRHTFITKAKAYGMDDNLLKLIVGHSIQDITEKVYTHRTKEDLIRAMAVIEK